MMKKILTLTEANFAPYGTVLNPSDCGFSVNEPGEPVQFYPDRMLQLFPTSNLLALGPLTIKPRPFLITATEKHLHTEEILGGFNQDVCFHVALDQNGQPNLDDLQIFLLPAGWWVRVKREVWHQAPFVLGSELAVGMVLLPPHTYTNDCVEVKLDSPLVFKP